jgi:ribonuclease D
VLGVFVPIPALLAIMINNGSCILAALNALRPLRFSAAPEPRPALAGQAAASPLRGLSLRSLAQRLGVSTQRLVARRESHDFANWSASNDPHQLAWRYEPIDRLFLAEQRQL